MLIVENDAVCGTGFFSDGGERIWRERVPRIGILTETIENTEVFGFIDSILKEKSLHFEESGTGEQRVGTGLMSGSNSGDSEILGELIETATEIFTTFHEIFDIVDAGKVGVQQVEEFLFGDGQLFASENLEEVSEIVTTMKGDPTNIGVQNDATAHEEFSKLLDVDSLFVVLFEVDSAFCEHLDGVLSIDILIEIKLEIELPSTDTGGQIALSITKSETELNDFEQIDIASKSLIVIFV